MYFLLAMLCNGCKGDLVDKKVIHKTRSLEVGYDLYQDSFDDYTYSIYAVDSSGKSCFKVLAFATETSFQKLNLEVDSVGSDTIYFCSPSHFYFKIPEDVFNKYDFRVRYRVEMQPPRPHEAVP